MNTQRPSPHYEPGAAIPGRRLVIGIDGGGSGCRARIEDVEGRFLGAGEAPAAAVRLGLDRSMASVEAAARLAVKDAGLPAEALGSLDAAVGLAGVGRKGVLEALAAQPQPFRTVKYLNDATIACIGAHAGQDGGVVIVGTGSVGLAIVDGREIRIGGYGFPLSDEASGADLGLKAIRQALRAHDGRVAASDLTSEIMAQFDGDPFEVVAWMDWATASDYAKFAPLIMERAERGDVVARPIVSNAASEIGRIVCRLMTCGARRIALLGGLAPRFERWLDPDILALLVAAKGDAVDGALYVARAGIATAGKTGVANEQRG